MGNTIFRKKGRITLNLLEEGDVDNLVNWLNDEEVTSLLSFSWPVYRGEELNWIKGLPNRKEDLILAIVIEDGKHIGNIGLHGISSINRNCELGIFIGEKDFWGKRYGKEAISAMLDYAFLNLNLLKVRLSVYSFNERAHACYKSVGFKQEGLRAMEVFRNGQWHDVVLMAIFVDDWMKKKTEK